MCGATFGTEVFVDLEWYTVCLGSNVGVLTLVFIDMVFVGFLSTASILSGACC